MKTPVHTLRSFLKRTSVLVATAAVLIATTHVSFANQAPFTRLFVFGDSLSDIGNFHSLTAYPPAPYYDGRFSNGKLWVEYLAESLQMQPLPGDNYAVAGATTGRLNVKSGLGGMTFSGLQDEIDSYQASHTAADANGALFVVWAGANDFFATLESNGSPQDLISNGVANTVTAVVRLKQSGAQHILVPNVPDLGVTPYALSSGAAPHITALCAAYNQVLNSALDQLAAAGVATIRVDAFSSLDKMASQPTQFGFIDTTTPFLYSAGDASQFLFWDAVHPTTRGHEVLAQDAAHSVLSYFCPPKTSPKVKSLKPLHGLTRAKRK